MFNRREFFGITVGAGATLALTPELLHALQESGGKLMQRAIPSSGEMLPVIGLGRGWARSLDHAALKEVIETLVEGGGKVIDTVHGDPPVQQLVGTIANELGIQNKIFWSTGLAGPSRKADPAAVKAEIEKSFATFKVSKLDLVQVITSDNLATHLAVLKEMKEEGRVRYIGVTDLLSPPNMDTAPVIAKLASIMESEPIDFIGIDYSVGDRRVEEKLLPLARERKIGVMAYFPFDRSRIFKRANTTPLPDWAAEFDAKTWAQFFLKYVISHPAVTVVRASTTQAAHMLDNIGAGSGRLPNETTRKRMAELVDSWQR